MTIRVFLFVGCFLAGTAFSQVLSNYRFSPIADAQISSVAEKYEVHQEHDGSFEVIVPTTETRDFLKLVPQAELVEWDIKDIFRRMDESEPGWREQYHKFSDVENILRDYDKNYPKLAHLETYGKSAQGRPLYALRLTAATSRAPEIMLTASTHGDELITVEVILAIMERLVKGFETDPRITRMLSTHVIYIVPVVNPDGFVSTDRYDNGVDPNRSFPWSENPSASSTASIKALIKFFSDHNFLGSIDFHASGQLLMYPWGYTQSAVEKSQADWYRETTAAMAKINGYRAGQISRILYVAKGSSADYWQWKNGTHALGIEMATSKIPSPSQIPAVVKENMESTLLFIEYF